MPLSLLAPAQARAATVEQHDFRLPLLAGAASEATAAVDPANPRRLAVAINAYQDPAPVRIQVLQSGDGGRTWSRPVTVLPPGTAKSYDPALAFARDGSLLVSGGASLIGADFCQPASRVFLARLGPGAAGPAYRVGPVALPGNYNDRPALGYDAAAGLAYLTWTFSTGPQAECQAVPGRSQTLLATAGPSGIGPARPFPDSLGAPYGSAVAVLAPGVALVAAAERAPDGQQQILTAVTRDGGVSYAQREVIAEGQVSALAVPGLSALSLSTPTLAVSPAGRVAAAWTQAGPGGQATAALAVSVGAPANGPVPWQAVAAPPVPAGATVLAPAVAFAGSQLLLGAGVLSGEQLGFTVFRRLDPQHWQAALALGTGRGDAYREVGESIGLAAAGNAMVAAAPLGERDDSALVIRTAYAAPPLAASPAPSPGAGTSAPATPSTSPAAAATRSAPGAGFPLGRLLLALVVGLGAAAVLLRIRARRRW